MKGKRKNDINVEGSGEMKMYGRKRLNKQWGVEIIREKGWRSVNIKKKNVKNNYRKIGKKKDNDLNADVGQLREREKERAFYVMENYA